MSDRLRKLVKWSLLAVALGLVVVALLSVWTVRRAWPQVEGTLQLAGLQAPVEVIRDSSGVPHIYAENDHDLVFAQGFVHAQDRLWSMDFDRRMASGRLSEILGGMTLRLDRYLRTMGSRRSAERDYEALTQETRDLLQAYCDGVNAFIDTHRGRYPVEYSIFRVSPAPWEPVDILVRAKLMAWLLSENQQFELSRARMIARLGEEPVQALLPPYRDGAPLIVPPGADGYPWLADAPSDELTDPLSEAVGGPTPNWGSNQWSVAGHLTASGKPLMANDTHLGMAMPSVWYHNGLHGGSFDVVGASLPGVPLVILGTTGRVAWGVTDMLPDVQDFYIERLDDPENPTRYEVDGEWYDLEVITETIAVKGSDPVVLEVHETRHGPIMNGVIGKLRDYPEKVAVRWSEHDPNRVLDAIIALGRAHDWDSFRAALEHWSSPHMNFGYADADGNIGYQSTGRVPIRAEGHQGLVPVPGSTREFDWQGFIPFDELPRSLNPDSGLVYSANNKIVGDEYPYHLAHEWSDPYRAMRIGQLLADREGMTVDDMAVMQMDSLSLHAESLWPILTAVQAEGAMETAAMDLVKDWDLRLDASSAAAAIFQVWYRYLVEESFDDELGEVLGPEYLEYYWIHGPVLEALGSRPADPWFDDISTEGTVETLPEISQRAWGHAMAWLGEHYGGDPSGWSWGAIHPMVMAHRPIGQSGIAPLERIFNGPPVPAPGDRFTLNAAWFSFQEGRPYSAEGGAGQRLIVDLADPDNSRFIQNSGQTEHLFHPRRHDLQPLWQAGETRPLHFSREAVEADRQATLILQPEVASP